MALFLCWLAEVRTDGFSTSKIENPYPFSSISSEGGTSEIGPLFSQPFTYLSQGRQSFVFASEDGKIVLKFFKQNYFRNPWYLRWVEKIPFSCFQQWSFREAAKRDLRKGFYLNSYRIAFSKAKEETGLLYFHLGNGKKILPSVQIVDKASRKYRIDLNSIPFVLQKKGEPFYPGLDTAFKSEGIAGICKLLDQFVERVADRIGQKIGDADRDIEHNWGVLDGQVLHLDPGRFYLTDDLSNSEGIHREWRRASENLLKWLKQHYPEAEEHLKKAIKTKIPEIDGAP